jgi:three-Cys-motif partner protein
MSNPQDIYFNREKSAATRAKHELLSRYQKIWQGIILNGLKNNAGSLVYLDVCAGSGLFPAKDAEFLDEAGSPLIGLFNLSTVKADTRFITDNKEFYALLYEKDVSLFSELITNLQNAGFSKEMYFAENTDYLDRIETILDCVKNSFTLAFFDPFSIAPLPFNVLSKIMKSGKTDALIFFPAKQIQKYQGHITGSDFTGKDALLNQMSDFFGTVDWMQIIQDVNDGNEAIEKLTKFYMSNIAKLGKHSLALDFLYEEQENVLFKIIFATSNTEAALQAKRVFSEISAFQAFLKREKSFQQLLFNEKEQIYEMPDAAIAEAVYTMFRGTKITGEKLYHWALFDAGPGVFKNNLKRALTILKRERRIINPDGYKWNSYTKIEF